MAEAGFFQVSYNPPHLATSAMFKGDRVTCFACHVYLYNWEPHDEPWSEHERHAIQCPFMRGDPTENVPLEGMPLVVAAGINVFIDLLLYNNNSTASLSLSLASD